MENIVIVGGGIAGLTTAGLINKIKPNSQVFIVELNPELGGLLRSFDYGEFGHFDYGMHYFSETGIEELDQFQRNMLPKDKWHDLTNPMHSMSAAFYAGKLQFNSHYPDLRKLDRELYKSCVADFFMNLQNPFETESSDIISHSKQRMGSVIANQIIKPIVEKIHQFPADKIHKFALNTPPIDRVIMYDEDIFKSLMLSDTIRERLAFPEQRNLPTEYSSGLNCFYPKNYGLFQAIDGLREQLLKAGTHLLTSTKVSKINYQDGSVTSLELLKGEEKINIEDISHVYWTGSLISLASIMPLLEERPTIDPFHKTVLVNFVLDQSLDMKDLYHLWCLDSPYKTYRVTDFSNYCPNSSRAGGLPYCVELIISSDSTLDNAALCDMAYDELNAFGVLKEGTRVLFSKAETLSYGFPFPLTCQNMSVLDSIRNALKQLELKNMTPLGILAEPTLFFHHHVLSHAYKKIYENS